MEAMLELKKELRDYVTIQIVAFPQEGILSYPNGKELLENAVKMGADCVGAIPHFEFTREYAVESVNYCMELAERYDRLVDVHCDEIDDEQSRGLEVLACRALESGLKTPGKPPATPRPCTAITTLMSSVSCASSSSPASTLWPTPASTSIWAAGLTPIPSAAA